MPVTLTNRPVASIPNDPNKNTGVSTTAVNAVRPRARIPNDIDRTPFLKFLNPLLLTSEFIGFTTKAPTARVNNPNTRTHGIASNATGAATIAAMAARDIYRMPLAMLLIAELSCAFLSPNNLVTRRFNPATAIVNIDAGIKAPVPNIKNGDAIVTTKAASVM